MVYQLPGQPGALHQYQAHYDHYIGGQWVPPAGGQYFDVVTPITGKIYTKAARGTAADIEKALDAAHAAADVWGKTSATERATSTAMKIAELKRWAKAWNLTRKGCFSAWTLAKCFTAHSAPPLVQRNCWDFTADMIGEVVQQTLGTPAVLAQPAPVAAVA